MSAPKAWPAPARLRLPGEPIEAYRIAMGWDQPPPAPPAVPTKVRTINALRLGTKWEADWRTVWAITPWNARVKLCTINDLAPANGVDPCAVAHVMAAGEDLLAAAARAEDFIAGFEDEQTQPEVKSILAGLRAAITKATGGAA